MTDSTTEFYKLEKSGSNPTQILEKGGEKRSQPIPNPDNINTRKEKHRPTILHEHGGKNL